MSTLKVTNRIEREPKMCKTVAKIKTKTAPPTITTANIGSYSSCVLFNFLFVVVIAAAVTC